MRKDELQAQRANQAMMNGFAPDADIRNNEWKGHQFAEDVKKRHIMIALDDTNFCRFGRNLAGNPDRNLSHKPVRTCAILVPEDRVRELTERGINVKERVDKDDDSIVYHYVNTTLSYADSHGNPLRYPPKVYLVNEEGKAIPLPEEAITGELDYQPVKCINVVLNPYEYQPGKWCLYVRTLYIEPDYERMAYLAEREKEFDPYAARYRHD